MPTDRYGSTSVLDLPVREHICTWPTGTGERRYLAYRYGGTSVLGVPVRGHVGTWPIGTCAHQYLAYRYVDKSVLGLSIHGYIGTWTHRYLTYRHGGTISVDTVGPWTLRVDSGAGTPEIFQAHLARRLIFSDTHKLTDAVWLFWLSN